VSREDHADIIFICQDYRQNDKYQVLKTVHLRYDNYKVLAQMVIRVDEYLNGGFKIRKNFFSEPTYPKEIIEF
jgi:hypothetical protein